MHTSYKVYPKAINLFMNENHDLKNINFGNIKNNIDAILQKLKLNKTIECVWDISPLYFFDKIGISKNDNKPSDFDEYSNFKFNFKAKEGVSNKDFEKAIAILESDFINRHQEPLNIEVKKIREDLKKRKRKTNLLIYALSFIVFSVLISIIFYLKNQ
jgi:hypothetical protein